MSFYELVAGEASNVRLETLRAASDLAGARRAQFLKTRASIKGPLFTVPYGQGTATVGPDGAFVDKAEVEKMDVDAVRARFAINKGLYEESDVGAAPLNKLVGEMRVPYGVCAIIGGSGVGKTPLAHHLALSGVKKAGIVRAGEPFIGYDIAHPVIARDIATAAFAHADVVVDSIKDLLSDGKALMRGGISRQALLELSAWSVLGSTIGTTFYVPVNPSSDDPSIFALLTESVISSSTMVMVHEGSKWRYASRRGEGLPRDSGTFEFSAESGSGDNKSTLADEKAVAFDGDFQDIIRGVIDRNRVFNR